MRHGGGKTCLVVTGRLFAKLVGDQPQIYPGGSLWAACSLKLPQPFSQLRNVLTGTRVTEPSDRLSIERLLAELPAAVLMAEAGV